MATTPLMTLTLPDPSVTAGPAWATILNAAMNVIDAHDHSTGKGTKITPSGININANLEFNDNNLIEVKSARFEDQVTALAGGSDLACVYNVGGELYYNDGAGNQIQLTSGGAINASAVGGIGGDYTTSSASATYSSASQKFLLEQSAGVNANIDVANVLIREAVGSANAITVKSPTSLGSAYDLTLPTAVPGSTLPVLMNSSGALSTAQLVSAQIADDAIITAKIPDLNVTTAKINDLAVTDAKIANSTITAGKLASGVIAEMQSVEFTSSGTWVVPTNVNAILILGVGGGGGGGAGGGTSGGSAGGGGGGGGAGADPRLDQLLVVPGETLTITIGAAGTGGTGVGGAGGNNGTAGGNTIISGTNDILTFRGAAGGSGGVLEGAGGAGGTGGRLRGVDHNAGGVGRDDGNGGTGATGGNGFYGDGGDGGSSGGASALIGGAGGGGGAGFNNGGTGGDGGNSAPTAGTEGASGAYGCGGGGGGGAGVGTSAGASGANGDPGYIRIYYVD